jgi:hypothetical protein
MIFLQSVLRASAPLLAILLMACALPPEPAGLNQSDGTYDFSFVYTAQGGARQTVVLSRYLIVTNGIISSNPIESSGSVLDTFSNVRFTGPCPIGNGGAVFTGVLNLRNPKGGMGSWQCNIGGVSNTWRAYNGG